jgi:hypothetical protein
VEWLLQQDQQEPPQGGLFHMSAAPQLLDVPGCARVTH